MTNNDEFSTRKGVEFHIQLGKMHHDAKRTKGELVLEFKMIQPLKLTNT